MKIGVCLKQVPSTDTRIQINPTGTGILTNDVKFELNPYDEFALEEAVKLKGEKKATEVIVFSIGDAASEARVRDALARGADRAVRLDDAGFAAADSLGRAQILAAALKAEGVSLVLAGRQAVDTDQGTTAVYLAELLGWAQATWVDKLVIDGGSFTANRAAGGGVREVVTGGLPAVITCDKGLNNPRFPTLPNIMAAKKKPIAVKKAADIGLSLSGNVVVEDNYGLPPARPAGKIIPGDAASAAKELVRLLRTEAKVI